MPRCASNRIVKVFKTDYDSSRSAGRRWSTLHVELRQVVFICHARRQLDCILFIISAFSLEMTTNVVVVVVIVGLTLVSNYANATSLSDIVDAAATTTVLSPTPGRKIPRIRFQLIT